MKNHRLLGITEFYLKGSEYEFLPSVYTISFLFLDKALYPW